MSARDDGGPAFPHGEVRVIESAVPPYSETVTSLNKPGMTLRDYFAAKAMQGILSSPNFAVYHNNVLAAKAYEIADAMLAAREAA